MFIKALKMLWDSESLKTIAEEHFVNTLFDWRGACPEETVGICDEEFNSKGLALCSINITEANRPLVSLVNLGLLLHKSIPKIHLKKEKII